MGGAACPPCETKSRYWKQGCVGFNGDASWHDVLFEAMESEGSMGVAAMMHGYEAFRGILALDPTTLLEIHSISYLIS